MTTKFEPLVVSMLAAILADVIEETDVKISPDRKALLQELAHRGSVDWSDLKNAGDKTK